MTIFVDAYHTPIGMIHDTRKVVSSLEQSAVRESLHDTNLGVRSENGITPMFVTGCRDSESGIPPFTHPISVKISNGSQYLFTDMRLFVRAGAQLYNLQLNVRRQEEFDFTKMRAIASLAWAAGDRSRFEMNMRFAGVVFATWVAQAIGRTERLTVPDQLKVQLIALAFYSSLFREGAVHYANDDGMRMAVARHMGDTSVMKSNEADSILRTLEPLSTFSDMCEQISKTIQSALLKGLNKEVLLNLLAGSFYATNGSEILKVSVEHPPTWCSILFFCMSYNNFKKSPLGQTIQNVGRNGKSDDFSGAFRSMVVDYTQPQGQIRSVFEYRMSDAQLSLGNHLDPSKA